MSPLRSLPFRYQFAARSVSMIGSTLSPVALSLGVLACGLSAADLGIILAAYTVPLVALVVFGGVVADRLPQHRVMLAGDLIRAVSQTAVGVLLLGGHPGVWGLAALQVVTGTATAFYQPASSGLTAFTVDRPLLQRANALLAMSRSLSGSVGPLFAAALVVTAGAGWALIIDGASFLGSAILLSRVRDVRRPEAGSRSGFRAEMREGFHEVRTRFWVWSSIVTFGVGNLAASMLLVLGPVVMLRRHDAGMFGWAAIVAAMSVGQVIGNIIALRVTPARPMMLVRIVELAQIPLTVGVALSASLPVLIPAGMLCGAGMAVPDAIWFTTLQSRLPSHAIARVSSYDWLGSVALRPVGLACAAAVADAVGIRPALLTVSSILAAICVAGALSPGIRGLRGTGQEAEEEEQWTTVSASA
jgi:MFS family permease